MSTTEQENASMVCVPRAVECETAVNVADDRVKVDRTIEEALRVLLAERREEERGALEPDVVSGFGEVGAGMDESSVVVSDAGIEVERAGHRRAVISLAVGRESRGIDASEPDVARGLGEVGHCSAGEL